jgi:BrnA antitoxin of type II toxin-antitoxin system
LIFEVQPGRGPAALRRLAFAALHGHTMASCAREARRMLAASLRCTYNVRMSSLRFEWDLRKAAANGGSALLPSGRECHSHHLGAQGHAPGAGLLSVGITMRKQYDFSASRKNPYAAQLKKPVTIRLDQDSITYFKSMSEQTGIPYQSLINLYLKECASSGKKLNLAWK